MDQMNLVMALDNKMSRELEQLAPHKSMLDMNKPRSLTNNAAIPKPVASTIANWLDEPDEDNLTPEQEAFLTACA